MHTPLPGVEVDRLLNSGCFEVIAGLRIGIETSEDVNLAP
jgi:hypothetical protein